jgi:hypothetical protein
MLIPSLGRNIHASPMVEHHSTYPNVGEASFSTQAAQEEEHVQSANALSGNRKAAEGY